MKRAEAEKLLGGHAAGILTEVERRTLFEAALAHQELFDALMDEEALRELLADPAARAQVLAALALSEAAPPRLVPFWRRPGIIGAAAGILVATTAGLAVLRSPEAQPPAAKAAPASSLAPAPAPAPAPALAATPVPEVKAEASLAPRTAARLWGAAEARQAAVPSPASAPTPAAPVPVAQAPAEEARAKEARTRADAESRRMEARDQVSKQADAAGLNRASALVEVAGGAPAPAPRLAAKAAPAPVGMVAPLRPVPVWSLDPLPDGAIRVTVRVAAEAHVVLLKRGAAGVEVLKPEPMEALGPWRFQARPAPDEVLDLYVLNGAAAEPARLPETGPVDGFRARIFPAGK